MRALHMGRRQAGLQLRRFDELVQAPSLSAVLGQPEAAPARAVVRRAAVHASVIALYREALQQLANWLVLPLGAGGILLVTDALLGRWEPQVPASRLAAVAGGCLVLNVLLLVWAVVADRVGIHAAGAGAAAVVGAVGLVATDAGPPAAVRVALVFSMVPAAAYLATLPLVVIAYAVAIRLSWLIDPRARIILGLLQCLHQTAAGAAWLQDGLRRKQVLGSLERLSRIAQRDLPKLLPLASSDRQTRLDLRDQAYAIAARLRECKQRVVLPSARTHTELPLELAGLFLHACCQEWQEMGGPNPDSRAPGRLARISRRVGAALLLAVAAFAIPAVFHNSLPGDASRYVRDVLIVSAVLALVPLPQDMVTRIPDTFAGALR